MCKLRPSSSPPGSCVHQRMELLLCVKFRSLCDGRFGVIEEISTLSRCSGDEDFMPG
ncbi:unnamed protein product [Brassica napus]|uniref:(rape) hypothetical protein n=1 Tax=Brassica napus TaxID=3708 RepID=A0A816K3F1_BRANA|nr:unnamed protein product [Brassica napus]